MNARVLLIDGDAGWAHAAAGRLGVLRPGLAVESCRSAARALKLAEKWPVALAVSNLVLPRPGSGGASTLARLRELYPSCRTVLVTEQEALVSLLEGVAHAIVAPRDLEEWLEAEVGGLYVEPGATVDGSTIVVPEVEVDGSVGGGRAGSSPESPTGLPLFDSQEVPMEQRVIGGKYRPIERIGAGGMGEVWRAEDTFIQRFVALKLMQVPKTSDPEEMRQRMHREVVIAGRLSHPHFVTIHDAGLEGRDVFLVMELVSGPTLAEALEKDGPLEPARAVALGLQVLDALSQAHRLGFIHRDLKPSNVLMASPELIKVADFGLAKLFRVGEGAPALLKDDLTLPEYAVGTPPYMAPEQLRCEATDARTDLYAVGLLLFEMLHGVSLAHLIKPLARARAMREQAFDQPLPVLAGEPKLQSVLERALAVDPAKRFQDAESFAQELDLARSSWQKHLPRLFPRRGGS